MTDDSLEIILALIKQLESTMLGLRQLRELVAKGLAQHMVDELIQEGELKLAELKRRLIQ